MNRGVESKGGAELKFRINKAHFPVTTLGYGRRLGLWVQGCAIRCRGCVSRDTWDAGGGWDVEPAEVVAWCDARRAQEIDGITISGGEPFEQPRALAALLEALNAWRRGLDRAFDILCYSGLPRRRIERRHPGILAMLDVLIPEPYVDGRMAGGRAPRSLWRGSDNQPLVALTPLGRTRYDGGNDAVCAPRIQVSIDRGGAWFIGIPRPGDMDRLEEQARARGVILEEVSWRA